MWAYWSLVTLEMVTSKSSSHSQIKEKKKEVGDSLYRAGSGEALTVLDCAAFWNK